MNTAISAVAIAVAALVAVIVLRNTTMTVHVDMPPDSRLVVEASARTRGDRDNLAALTSALVNQCAAETAAESEVRDFRFHRDHDFTFALVPGLDEPDRRQLHGCLSDLRMPALLISVDAMRSILRN